MAPANCRDLQRITILLKKIRVCGAIRAKNTSFGCLMPGRIKAFLRFNLRSIYDEKFMQSQTVGSWLAVTNK